MIVMPHSLRGCVLHLRQVVPLVLGQPFVARRSVESFDIGILLGVAGLGILGLDSFCCGPLK